MRGADRIAAPRHPWCRALPDRGQAADDRRGPIVSELYSGTEAFGHTFITAREWLDHPGSVGRPASGCEVRIVDEAGRMLGVGEVGRIMMRNGLRIAYHGDDAKTAALYDPEGFASPDIGYLDADGYLYRPTVKTT